MKIFLLSLLVAVKAFGISGSDFPDINAKKNWIKNPSCAKNAFNITASGGTLAKGTTTPLDIDTLTECNIDASSSGQTYTWAAKTWSTSTAAGLKNANCEAKFIYDGDASLYKTYVKLGSTQITTDLQLASSSSSSTPISINFPCGDLTSSPTLVIEATSNSAAAIGVAKVYLGEVTNLGKGNLDTDWASFTVVSSWVSNATLTGQWRRVGDTAEIRYKIALTGAPTAATLTLNTPTVCTIDTTKIATGIMVSVGHVLDSGSDEYPVTLKINTTTQFTATTVVTSGGAGSIPSIGSNVNATAPMTFANGDLIDFFASVPCVGWSSSSAVSISANTLPTIQKFTSGTSQTYTRPAGVSHIKVRMVGGGGGGSDSGAAGGANGGNGGDTIFGAATAGGGGGGAFLGAPGAGGTPTLGGYTGTGLYGGKGGGYIYANSSLSLAGGIGGVTVFGGAGSSENSVAGTAGATNTGAGGGGGGTAGASQYTGSGGGSGAYVEFLIQSPAATYTYSVGAAGAASTDSASGVHKAGGAGGSGIIIVEEYYQQANVPILVGSVTSGSIIAERIERAVFNLSGTSTVSITSQSGSWISSATASSSLVTVNFTSGIFSAAPACSFTCSNSTANTMPVFANSVGPSTSVVYLACVDTTNTTKLSNSISLICMGPR